MNSKYRDTEGVAVQGAKWFCYFAHEGQKDKAGYDYYLHPLRVAKTIREQYPTDEEAQIVAYLHDVVEDTDKSLAEIERHFGPTVAKAVDAITRRHGELPEDYYRRVGQNYMARIVKIADIEDNTSDDRMSMLEEEEQQRLYRKYLNGLMYLVKGME